MAKSKSSGRGYARLGFTLGISTSIAANVGHSILNLASGQPGWVKVSAVGSGAFWPMALLICLEIIARVAWPKGWQWVLTRHFGLLLVAIIAAVASYRHMNGLLLAFAEDGFTATAGPLAIDGLMFVSSVALLAIGHNARQRQEEQPTPEPTPEPLPAPLPTPRPEPKPEPLPIPVSPGVGPAPDMPQKPMPVKDLQNGKVNGKRGPAPGANEDQREQARKRYLQSVDEGTPITGDKLGAEFGMSPRWGRVRIQEAKALVAA